MNQSKRKATLQIRLIEKNDNAVVADIIHLVMTEFEAVGCGYSINDSEVDNMYTAYAPDRHAFYVIELDGQVLGCGGFGPLTGAGEDICELRKMYFKSELRGLGVGTQLLNLCLEEATKAGFRHCYLKPWIIWNRPDACMANTVSNTSTSQWDTPAIQAVVPGWREN